MVLLKRRIMNDYYNISRIGKSDLKDRVTVRCTGKEIHGPFMIMQDRINVYRELYGKATLL